MQTLNSNAELETPVDCQLSLPDLRGSERKRILENLEDSTKGIGEFRNGQRTTKTWEECVGEPWALN